MNKYLLTIFENGRIALIEEKDYNDALEQGKEILVFCGGWSGGYAKAFGAYRNQDYDNTNNGEDCFMCYSYDVKEEIFACENLAKFHRIIVTNGIKVYMKTKEPATIFFDGTFSDLGTSLDDYVRKIGTDKTVTREKFEKMRHEIDIKKTLNMICGEKEEIKNAISEYLYHKEV